MAEYISKAAALSILYSLENDIEEDCNFSYDSNGGSYCIILNTDKNILVSLEVSDYYSDGLQFCLGSKKYRYTFETTKNFLFFKTYKNCEVYKRFVCLAESVYKHTRNKTEEKIENYLNKPIKK